jgi:hypothetical protein
MPSLGIAPGPEGCNGDPPRIAGLAPVSDVFPADVNFHPLEIGLQAIQLRHITRVTAESDGVPTTA